MKLLTGPCHLERGIRVTTRGLVFRVYLYLRRVIWDMNLRNFAREINKRRDGGLIRDTRT